MNEQDLNEHKALCDTLRQLFEGADYLVIFDDGGNLKSHALMSDEDQLKRFVDYFENKIKPEVI
jgi:hypothetical protein